MHVKYVDIAKQWKPFRDEVLTSVSKILDHGQFILGPEVSSFENDLANFLNVKHVIGVGSGTDALYLSLKSLGLVEGDEVITTGMSYLATASSVALNGAKIVYADVRDNMLLDPLSVVEKITNKTRAIIVVHLSGLPCKMQEFIRISQDYGVPIIEDCAQAIGSTIDHKQVGTFGYAGCFSMHPLKNLGAMGDAGAIVTNNDDTAEFLRLARNHGHSSRDECEFWSHNMRLDTLQAAFLSLRLSKLPEIIKRRNEIASFYNKRLRDYVKVPIVSEQMTHSYHTYVIQTELRDELKKYLEDMGVETKIHYPTPIHRLNASAGNMAYLKKTDTLTRNILSLPIAEYLTDAEVEYVSDCVTGFFLR